MKGAEGAEGPSGPKGVRGNTGINGRNGRNGPRGEDGEKGVKGGSGPQVSFVNTFKPVYNNHLYITTCIITTFAFSRYEFLSYNQPLYNVIHIHIHSRYLYWSFGGCYQGCFYIVYRDYNLDIIKVSNIFMEHFNRFIITKFPYFICFCLL